LLLCGTSDVLANAAGACTIALDLPPKRAGDWNMPKHLILALLDCAGDRGFFLYAFSDGVTTKIHSMADALAATQWRLAREQKLTAWRRR